MPNVIDQMFEAGQAPTPAAPPSPNPIDALLSAPATTPKSTSSNPIDALFPSQESPATGQQPQKGPQTFSDAWNEPGKGFWGHAWNVANTPMIDADSISNWTGRTFGFEPGGVTKGVAGLVSGFTTPLSIALMLGGPVGKAIGLFETGGAAFLAREAGMTADEIGQVTKGSEFIAKAAQAGKTAAEGLADASAAGIDPDTVTKGLTALKQAGLTPEALLSNGLVRRVGSSMLRSAVGAAKAEQYGAGLQGLMDAGFTAQMLYGAAIQSPRFLDAVRDGDWEKAKELAIETAGSGTLGVLGAIGTLHEAGGAMDDLAAKAGLKVKPSEEVLKLMNHFGIYDADALEVGNAEKNWENDIRKKYGAKDSLLSKARTTPQDLRRVMNWIQAEGDENLMRDRGEKLARAAGLESPVTGQPEQVVTPEIVGNIPKVATTPPWEMRPSELEEAEKNARADEKQSVIDVFGEEKAKEYERLQRTANSAFDPKRADEASEKLKEMESNLTPAQERRLYGFGETGTSYEEYQDFRRALNGLDYDSPEALGRSLQYAIGEIGNADLSAPEKMRYKERLGYAQLREAFRYTDEQGWDPQIVYKAALEAAAKRYGPDAEFMLDRFLKKDTGPKKLEGAVEPTGQEQAKPAAPVQADDAQRRMSEARQQELIDAAHLKNSKNYTAKELSDLVDSYDPSKLTDEHKALAKEIEEHFSKNLEAAQKSGALREGIDHYVTQLWGKDVQDNPAVNTLLHDAGTGRFAVNTSMARRRVLESAFEGELLGKKLAVTDPIALAAHNGNAFGRVAAARDTLDRIRGTGVRASDGRPMVALSGTGHMVEGENGENPAVLVNPKTIRSIKIADKVIQQMKPEELDRLIKDDKIAKMKDRKGNDFYAWKPRDYLTIDHPAMRDWNYMTTTPDGTPVIMNADLKVHPEAFDYLKKQLGKDPSPLSQNGLGRALLGAGREAKKMLLFGSPFHIVQEGLRAIMTGISPFGVDKWDLRNDPILRLGVENQLTLGKDYRKVEDYEEGLTSGGSKVLSKIPIVNRINRAQAWMEEFLFDRYIPSLKSRAFKDLFQRYKDAYPEWTDQKAAETAAADTNERFGGINYKRMGRSATTQDLLRVVTLAPDWLESEMRFMARTFGDEGKIARADVAKMAVGMWGVARVLNLLISGKAHNEAPFGVALQDKNGKEKVYSIRTLPVDMAHALSDPMGFMKGRFSPLVRMGTEAITGRDQYGRKIPETGIIQDIFKQVAPIPAQTAVKSLTGEAPEVSTPDQLYKAAGGTVYPYRTEAENLAAKLASSHSEAGEVDPASLRQHQFSLRLEDQLRSGEITLHDLNQLVTNGQMMPEDAKKIHKNVVQTKGMDPALARLYTQASRLAAPEFLSVWDQATTSEKAALSELLVAKRKAYYRKIMKEETPEQRANDGTLRRLRAMFPQAPVF